MEIPTKLSLKRDVKHNKSITPSTISDPFLHKVIHAAGHDLRSPIFVIRSYSHLLQKIKEKDKLEAGFNLVKEATYTMENKINALVELIDIYTQPMPAIESVAFSGIIEKTKYQLYNELQNARPTFIIDFETFPEIHFSSVFLQEIMFHLISNSLLHNKEAEDLTIKISTFKIDNQLVLQIEDNGQGIALDEKISNIKQPFYSTSEDPKSAGIGLSKVEAIAQVFKTKFTIESHYGLGMICQFYFNKA